MSIYRIAGKKAGQRYFAEQRDLHGDVVGDDSLFLQLEFLENIGLENLFNLWRAQSAAPLHRLTCPLVLRRRMGILLTKVPEVVGAEQDGQGGRVRNPFLLDNQGADDEKSSRDIDVVDVVARQ